MHRQLSAAACGLVFASLAAAQSPYATQVIDFTGTDASAALGQPTRTTDLGGAITPFNGSFDPTTYVEIGEAGSLTLAFDHNVLDNPADVQFGVDLLIFGNAFYFDTPYDGSDTNPTASAIFGDGGAVEVSADGVTFFPVPGIADAAFPTLGFTDVDLPYQGFDNSFNPITGLPSGTVESDFTRTVDPSFNAIGQDFDAILAAYGTSGGGVPIDFSSTGLASIRFVRITNDNPLASGITPEIDAIADVIPEPVALVGLVLLLPLRRRRV